MANRASKAPGKAHRVGVTLLALLDLFPDEETAMRWFESQVWPNGRRCGHCGGTITSEVPNAKPMPYWCTTCRSYFSVRTGTALERSRVPLRKWAIAIYLELTSLKSISSMKLHRDIGVTQATAWFMLHRIRESWSDADDRGSFSGPVEGDGRDILRREAPQHEQCEARGTGRHGPWPCRQDRCCGCEGSRHQASRCAGSAVHEQGDATRIRQGSRGLRSNGLHG